jgi:hypothetical protein
VAALILSLVMANLDIRSLAFRHYHLKYYLIQKRLSLMVGASNGVSATNKKCLELPELEFLEPLKLPVLTTPGVSLIGNAVKTNS